MNWGLAMTEHSKNQNAAGDVDLDLFFAAGREAAPLPDPALMAAVLADAHRVQADIAVARAPQAISHAGGEAQRGLWAQFRVAIGGWPALAGLASVATAGLWLGAVQPAGLGQAASLYLTDAGLYFAGADGYLVDVMPSFEFDLGES